MTFIHELDIPVFFLFAFILPTVLLQIFLLLSDEAPNFKSGVSLGLPRRVSLTNTLLTCPLSLSCLFYSPSSHDWRSSGSLHYFSLMHSKHFTNICKQNIALDISYLLAFVCI